MLAPRFSGSGNSPLRQLRQNGLFLEFDGLHHLAHEAVGKNHHGIAISIGEFKGESGQVGHLLYGVRREHDGAVVAVASAFHHLVIIALFRCDIAEAGSAARDVGDDAGQLGARHVADAFLHQADAGAARGRHAANAG